MDIGQTHRQLARVDIGALLAKVCTIDASAWTAAEGVRKHLAGPRPTQSIFICNISSPDMPGDRRVRPSDVPQLDGGAVFGPLVQPIMDELLADFPPDGVVVRCQIANLFAGREIKRHTDTGPLLVHSHRIHVPLITSPDVTFFVDNIKITCDPGAAFELNNQRMHGVINAGPDDRIHLLFDYLPADYDIDAVSWKKKKSPN